MHLAWGRTRERRDMADFQSWCTVKELVPVGGHLAGVIESRDDAAGVVALSGGMPNTYAKSGTLAWIAERMGKDGVADFLRNKLPTTANARSGDMGEILATAYLREEQGCVVGPSRL